MLWTPQLLGKAVKNTDIANVHFFMRFCKNYCTFVVANMKY